MPHESDEHYRCRYADEIDTADNKQMKMGLDAICTEEFLDLPVCLYEFQIAAGAKSYVFRNTVFADDKFVWVWRL